MDEGHLTTILSHGILPLRTLHGIDSVRQHDSQESCDNGSACWCGGKREIGSVNFKFFIYFGIIGIFISGACFTKPCFVSNTRTQLHLQRHLTVI